MLISSAFDFPQSFKCGVDSKGGGKSPFPRVPYESLGKDKMCIVHVL